MQVRDVEVGDVMFFTKRSHAIGRYARNQMVSQCVQSMFWCGCHKPDYKKVHVAICTQKPKNGTISIAHIARSEESSDWPRYINEIYNPSDIISHFDVLRPKDDEFTSALAEVASSGDSTIEFSMKNTNPPLQLCPPEAKKTTAGFSLESSCARFVHEAINITAEHTKLLNHRLNHKNISVYTRVIDLWHALETSKLYTVNPPAKLEQKQVREIKEAESDEQYDASTSTPLLQPPGSPYG